MSKDSNASQKVELAKKLCEAMSDLNNAYMSHHQFTTKHSSDFKSGAEEGPPFSPESGDRYIAKYGALMDKYSALTNDIENKKLKCDKLKEEYEQFQAQNNTVEEGVSSAGQILEEE